MAQLPNIDFKKPQKNPTIDADTSPFELPFYKDVEYFSNLDNFVGFIKGVERMIRTSKYYSRYIKYIKEEIGLDYCQVLSNIRDDYTEEDSKKGRKNTLIEMHHGPILTLFDYVSIVTDYLISKEKKVNSFIVAQIVLEEHFNNNVQIVMLSKTVHEQVHENNIFLNLNQAFGNLNAFLEKYYDGLDIEQIRKINRYIDTSVKYDSFDKDVLTLGKVIKKWKKDNGDDEE